MREDDKTEDKVESVELECKICYSRYDATIRRPKVLQCEHRVCAQCVQRLLLQSHGTAGEVWFLVSCPFCRQETKIRHNELWLMEEDTQVLSVLIRDQFQRKTRIPTRIPARSETKSETGSGEVLLSPASLSVSGLDSDCLLVSVLEVPEDMSSSLSVLSAIYCPPVSAHFLSKRQTWRRSVPRVLLGALCMVFFSSLPVGIYLLMSSRLYSGVALVSLVPVTLVLLVSYGLCQCLVQEAVDAARSLRHAHRNAHPQSP